MNETERKARRRAALLSGLVMPGAGQWSRGRRRAGAAIIAAVLILLAIMGVRIFFIVYYGLVPDGELVNMRITSAAISAIHRRAYVENWPFLVAILAVWAYSIHDALRR